MWRLRIVFQLALACLPSFLKIPIYRGLFGYQIGKNVRIGFSPIVGVKRCRIADDVRIGSLNAFYRVEDLTIGEKTRIGFLNLFRGGESIVLGPYVSILRQNAFNAILEADFVQPVVSRLELGAGVVVSSGHWLDFSAGLTLEEHAIVGGRNSTFWTHNRQRGRSVRIGHHCYLGSEIRVAPGVVVPPLCVVALGSVLSGEYESPRVLMGGNPATTIRALTESDYPLVTRKTRNDIPDAVAQALLPDDLRSPVSSQEDGKVASPPTQSAD